MSSKLRMLAEHLDYSGKNVSTIMRVLSDEYSRLHCDRESAIEYAVEKCEGECLYCGEKLYEAHGGKLYPSDNLHLDHIYPASYGGLFAKGNVALACANCNTKKSNRDPVQFYKDKIDEGLKCRFKTHKEFDSRILKPSVEILSAYFKGLKVEKVTSYGSKEVTSLRFTFQRQTKDSIELVDGLGIIDL